MFDLDETLIHCCKSSKMPFDFEFSLKTASDKKEACRVSVRPYAQELLRNLAEEFELMVFTASE